MGCVPPQTPYMLDIKGVENRNICEVLSAFEKLSYLSTAAIRGVGIGKVVLVMFEFKLRKITKWHYLQSEEDIRSEAAC